MSFLVLMMREMKTPREVIQPNMAPGLFNLYRPHTAIGRVFGHAAENTSLLALLGSL